MHALFENIIIITYYYLRIYITYYYINITIYIGASIYSFETFIT